MEDNVNHPRHYTGIHATVECIDVTRHLPFALGNAVKYIWRAGKKRRFGAGDRGRRKGTVVSQGMEVSFFACGFSDSAVYFDDDHYFMGG